MNTSSKNFHNMVRSVLGTRATYATLSSTPPALERAYSQIAALESRLNAARRRQGEALAGLRDQKDFLKAAAIAAILPIAGMLESYAMEKKDRALHARSKITHTDLNAMPNLDTANKCSELLATATTHAADLTTDYGLTAQQLEDADDLIGEFAALVGSPREGIKHRKAARLEIEESIDELREILTTRLDPLMRQFNDTANTPEARARRAFYVDYQSARIIIDLPGAENTTTTAETPEKTTPAK